MILDALLLVSDAQAFTAAAVSTNSVDTGLTTVKRELGAGEAMGFAFQVDVAASSTTVKLEIIMATDAALTTGIIVLVEATRLAADLAAGKLLWLGLPPNMPAAGALRYMGIRATPVGGAATVTLTSWLTPKSLFSVPPQNYSKGYSI